MLLLPLLPLFAGFPCPLTGLGASFRPSRAETAVKSVLHGPVPGPCRALLPKRANSPLQGRVFSRKEQKPLKRLSRAHGPVLRTVGLFALVPVPGRACEPVLELLEASRPPEGSSRTLLYYRPPR